MMPVSSRMSSGRPHPTGSLDPVLVVLYRRTRGMPASRRASIPAAMARRVTQSRAASRSSGKPNSSTRSRAPARPASLMTSSGSWMVSKRASPLAPFTKRVICRSRIRARSSSGTVPMKPSPRRIRATWSSSKTRVFPGRPRAAPVIPTRAGGRPPPSLPEYTWKLLSRKSANIRPRVTYRSSPWDGAGGAAARAAEGAGGVAGAWGVATEARTGSGEAATAFTVGAISSAIPAPRPSA